ncbi:MAG TPA: hypothetical protein DCM86_09650 [Verrucomicrobiales bacterium]|nr:hypothetical protein [Verrucomicrobiales bacterium]
MSQSTRIGSVGKGWIIAGLGALMALPMGSFAATPKVETTSNQTVRILSARMVRMKEGAMVTGTVQPAFGAGDLAGHHLHIEILDAGGQKLKEQDLTLGATNVGNSRRTKSTSSSYSAKFEGTIPNDAQVHIVAH